MKSVSRVIVSFLLIVTAACASAPEAPKYPEWETIPAGVLEVFCRRLQAEGIAAGAPVTVIRTTQKLATVQALSALGAASRKRAKGAVVQNAMRLADKSIPVTTTNGSCRWVAIDARQRRYDQMTLELSSPLPNPYARGAAGLFARMSLGGEHGSWYWIALHPSPAGWTVASIHPLGV